MTRKKSIIIFKPCDRSTLAYFARELEYKYGATDVRFLPFVNGIACYMDKGEHVQALSASRHIIAIEEDMTLSLPPFYEQKSPSWWWWWKPFPGWGKDQQIIPMGVERIRAHQIWNRSTGNSVKVAVLDTGFDLDHPDLQPNIAEGINLVDPDAPPRDDHGHGTHIAGIIAAADNNSGVIGVAPAARLYPVKALNSRGEGTLADVLEGLQWCIDNDMQVINLSIGTDSPSTALEQAITAVYQAGIVMVAAAGNDGTSDSVDFPAAYSQTISVGALTTGNWLAWYSSQGPEITLVAPGDQVLSTIQGGSYGRMSGTSMATAHVTAVVALIQQLKPELTPDQVTEVLTSSAEKLRGLKSEQQGAGLVRADRSVEQLSGT